MDHHGHILECCGYQFNTGQHAWNIRHMMGFVTALVYFALVLLAIGTALAFLTSWRAGCLGRDLAQLTSGLVWVYLSIKQFAQQKNTD